MNRETTDVKNKTVYTVYMLDFRGDDGSLGLVEGTEDDINTGGRKRPRVFITKVHLTGPAGAPADGSVGKNFTVEAASQTGAELDVKIMLSGIFYFTST